MVPLTAVSILLFGALGFYVDSIDTLIITFVAVICAVVVGIPLGVWMGHSKVVTAILTPILDVMQTMPSLVYLLPFAIFFGIGPACAVLVTLVYALPPVVRISAHAIRRLPPTTLEASESLGSAGLQRLRGVELPMAKRTIIVGVNQTMMAALSMATIAAFVDGPGLGQPVLEGLRRGQLGTSFVAGMCIVIMAIMLDRVTTAASERSETGGARRQREEEAASLHPRRRRGRRRHRGLPVEHPPRLQRVARGLGHRHAHRGCGRQLRRLADHQPVRASPAGSRTASPSGSSTRCRT